MNAAGKRIGYVDYRLDNFHANTYLKILRNELADRSWAVTGCTGMDAAEGRAWAAKNGVAFFEDPATLNEHVDAYMVLAPSNPEVHLELCEKVFPFGKTTYVDKTFAPDLATARRIFELADEHDVPVQTSSALRYTNVQAALAEPEAEAVQHMVAWGGGRSFDEYAIHPTELVISCMGPEAERLMRRGGGDRTQLLVDFPGGRTAVINVYTNAETPFAAAVTTAKATRLIPVDSSRIFVNMAAAILDLFETGKPNIDRRESLTIRRLLDAAADPAAARAFVEL